MASTLPLKLTDNSLLRKTCTISHFPVVFLFLFDLPVGLQSGQLISFDLLGGRFSAVPTENHMEFSKCKQIVVQV